MFFFVEDVRQLRIQMHSCHLSHFLVVVAGSSNAVTASYSCIFSQTLSRELLYHNNCWHVFGELDSRETQALQRFATTARDFEGAQSILGSGLISRVCTVYAFCVVHRARVCEKENVGRSASLPLQFVKIDVLMLPFPATRGSVSSISKSVSY